MMGSKRAGLDDFPIAFSIPPTDERNGDGSLHMIHAQPLPNTACILDTLDQETAISAEAEDYWIQVLNSSQACSAQVDPADHL
jgi:hypothetical protein